MRARELADVASEKLYGEYVRAARSRAGCWRRCLDELGRLNIECFVRCVAGRA